MLQDRFIYKGVSLEKGKEYEVINRAAGDKGWKIIYQKPRSHVWVLVIDDECVVVKENLIMKIKNKLRV